MLNAVRKPYLYRSSIPNKLTACTSRYRGTAVLRAGRAGFTKKSLHLTFQSVQRGTIDGDAAPPIPKLLKDDIEPLQKDSYEICRRACLQTSEVKGERAFKYSSKRACIQTSAPLIERTSISARIRKDDFGRCDRASIRPRTETSNAARRHQPGLKKRIQRLKLYCVKPL